MSISSLLIGSENIISTCDWLEMSPLWAPKCSCQQLNSCGCFLWPFANTVTITNSFIPKNETICKICQLAISLCCNLYFITASIYVSIKIILQFCKNVLINWSSLSLTARINCFDRTLLNHRKKGRQQDI